MKRILVCSILIIVLITCAGCFDICKSENAISTEAAPVLYGPYEVEYVKDGDTIQCNIEGKSITIRLIGIDTPESVHPDEDKNSKEGVLVSDYVKELLDGKEVYLEYDLDIEDDYGRTLAYVYVDNMMLNQHLIEKGYAVPMTIEPNIKYKDRFIN